MTLTWILLAAIGLTSGMLGGMLGIGGGVVIVPALILLFELHGTHPVNDVTVIAVATSMACIVFTSLSAAYAQFRAGNVVWPLFGRMTPFFVIGSFCAGLLAPHLPADLLRGLIGAFLLIVAVIMATSWKPQAHRPPPGWAGTSATGFGGGMISGIAGIAGGNVIVPTLVYFNTPMHQATGTSSAMGVPIALAGALGYATGTASASDNMLGLIHLPSWAWVTVGAVLAAPAGVKLAQRVPAATLKRFFAALLVLVSIRMIYTSFQL